MLTDHLQWEWIAVMSLAPWPVGLLLAWVVWRTGQIILGNLAGAAVIFGAAIAMIGREHAALQTAVKACLDANTTCWPTPSAFTRFAIYAGIALVEVFLVFWFSTTYEHYRGEQLYAPEWRR